MAGQDCHGISHRPTATCATGTARIRFVYFAVVGDNDPHARYHQFLVTAEVLLDRLLAAQYAGPRPIAPTLDDAAEARATVKPPRELFHPTTLEYRRWYDADGMARAQPLTREALAAGLAADGLSIEQARDRAAHRSHALPAADQAWLLNRRNTALSQRPLNQAEFHALIRALEGVWQVPAGDAHVLQANREIALRVAAVLASLLDEYVAPPFGIAALNDAFNQHLVAHLRQTIELSRVAGSAFGVLLVGPKAWFAAKAARMRAEHQIGLAMAPGARASEPAVGTVSFARSQHDTRPLVWSAFA